VALLLVGKEGKRSPRSKLGVLLLGQLGGGRLDDYAGILHEELEEVNDNQNLVTRDYVKDAWELANHTEDQLIDTIDAKNKLLEYAMTEGWEVWWIFRLILEAPNEALKLVSGKKKEISITKLRQAMLLNGFKLLKINVAIEKIFGRHSKKSSKEIAKSNIIEKTTCISTRRKESITMAKKNNGKRERLRELGLKEMKTVAKEIGYEITKKRKEEVAVELHGHMAGLPKDEALPDNAENWYVICDILLKGEANTRAEAEEIAAKEDAAEELTAEETTAIEEVEVATAAEAEVATAGKKKVKEKRYPQYVGKNPKGPDKRDKDFPVGSKVKYLGSNAKVKKFFAKKPVKIEGYKTWPDCGILVVNKPGKKSNVSANAIEIY
jgi:hypothetical protein